MNDSPIFILTWLYTRGYLSKESHDEVLTIFSKKFPTNDKNSVKQHEDVPIGEAFPEEPTRIEKLEIDISLLNTRLENLEHDFKECMRRLSRLDTRF
jgi:hypothetical protein